MSQWHRENPELIGSNADPWMGIKSYRKTIGCVGLCCEGRRWVQDDWPDGPWRPCACPCHEPKEATDD